MPSKLPGRPGQRKTMLNLQFQNGKHYTRKTNTGSDSMASSPVSTPNSDTLSRSSTAESVTVARSSTTESAAADDYFESNWYYAQMVLRMGNSSNRDAVKASLKALSKTATFKDIQTKIDAERERRHRARRAQDKDKQQRMREMLETQMEDYIRDDSLEEGPLHSAEPAPTGLLVAPYVPHVNPHTHEPWNEEEKKLIRESLKRDAVVDSNPAYSELDPEIHSKRAKIDKDKVMNSMLLPVLADAKPGEEWIIPREMDQWTADAVPTTSDKCNRVVDFSELLPIFKESYQAIFQDDSLVDSELRLRKRTANEKAQPDGQHVRTGKQAQQEDARKTTRRHRNIMAMLSDPDGHKWISLEHTKLGTTDSDLARFPADTHDGSVHRWKPETVRGHVPADKEQEQVVENPHDNFNGSEQPAPDMENSTEHEAAERAPEITPQIIIVANYFQGTQDWVLKILETNGVTSKRLLATLQLDHKEIFLDMDEKITIVALKPGGW